MPLRRSKSLFGTDKLVEEGYLDPISLRKAHLVTSAMDDDDDDDEEAEEHDEHKQNAQVGILGGENPEGSEANSPPCQGGPFSALTPSMWPSKGNNYLEYLITVQQLDFIWLAKKDNLMLLNWWQMTSSRLLVSI